MYDLSLSKLDKKWKYKSLEICSQDIENIFKETDKNKHWDVTTWKSQQQGKGKVWGTH